MAASDGSFRVCTINPSMIVGPAYQPEPVVSLQRFAAIINGERFADKIPNGSMSMIDVRDLAALHVNALENEQASGRYFGVKQSWHWRDILQALERACPAYKMQPPDPDEVPVRATQFDLSRQASLGASPRGLDDMLEGLVAEFNRRKMI
jgi:nucleoside-diphosphate-sugar epimerase